MKRFLLFGILVMLLCASECFGAWVRQTSGTTRNLYDVWFKRPPSGRGWAVGDSGTIVSTTNMGTNWIPQTSNTRERLWGVAWDLKYIGTKEWATAVGGDQYPGVAVHTTNGGNTWTLMNLPHYAPWAISYGDSLNGWAVGHTRTVYMTSDGGQNWAIQDSGGWRSAWYGVWFVNDRIGWTCGLTGLGGNIFKTTDGGVNWAAQYTASTLYGICFRDSLLGCAVGDFGRILRTTNGGASWDSVSTGSTETLYGVFLSYYGSLGYAVGANGRILATSDAGASWVAQVSGVTNTLRGVWCWLDLPGYWGFAVGDSGTILYQFIPLGVEEERAEVRSKKIEVRIRPNPFVSFATVQGHAKEQFAVYDIAGSRVGIYRGDRIGLGLNSGVYFITGFSEKTKNFKPVRMVKIR